jgi:hypothetical protein
MTKKNRKKLHIDTNISNEPLVSIRCFPSKSNFDELYKYCSTILNEKKRQTQNELFTNFIQDLDNKIKESLIDNKNSIILHQSIFNHNILNILYRLKLYVSPFRIIYRKKRYCEMTILEKICNDNLYLLTIDWKTKYNCYEKFYNLIIKYKKFSFQQNNIINTDDSDNSFEQISTS